MITLLTYRNGITPVNPMTRLLDRTTGQNECVFIYQFVVFRLVTHFGIGFRRDNSLSMELAAFVPSAGISDTDNGGRVFSGPSAGINVNRVHILVRAFHTMLASKCSRGERL